MPDNQTATDSLILRKNEPGICHLTINRPKAYNALSIEDLGSAYKYCSQVMAENMMARDAGEGMDAFLEKRVPVWTGE